jgi:hypothetical protein
MYANLSQAMTQVPTLAVISLDERPLSLGVVERALAVWPGIPTLVITQTPHRYDALDVPAMGSLAPGVLGNLVTALVMASTEWVLVMSGIRPLSSAQVTELWLARNMNLDAVLVDLADVTGLYRRELAYEWEPRLALNPPWAALLRDIRVFVRESTAKPKAETEILAREGGLGRANTMESSAKSFDPVLCYAAAEPKVCYEDTRTHGEDI